MRNRHLGGALAQLSDSPHGPLREPYAVYLFGVPASTEIAASIRAAQERLTTALPVTGRKPITFLAPTEKLAETLPIESLQRLRRLKEALDPRGIIRGNFALSDADPTSSKSFDADMME